jgi:hypothetical protein
MSGALFAEPEKFEGFFSLTVVAADFRRSYKQQADTEVPEASVAAMGRAFIQHLRSPVGVFSPATVCEPSPDLLYLLPATRSRHFGRLERIRTSD